MIGRGKYFDRYSCEFDFIPNVLTSLYIEGKIDEDIITNPFEWKKILSKSGYRYDFGLKHITVEKIESKSKKTKKFIITFPKPKSPPECFYALLYFDNKGCNYYTLELDIGNTVLFKDGGIICGQKGSSHLNYGRQCKDDKDEFIEMVQDIIDGKPCDIKNQNQSFKNVYSSAAEELGIVKNEEQFNEECIIF